MTLLRTSVLSLAVNGDDLHGVLVQLGPFGAQARDCGVIRGFLSLDPLERRSQAVRLLGARRRTARVILTGDSRWFMARAVGVAPGQWAGARDEVLRSIDRLLPIDPDAAVVGVVGLRAEHDPTEAMGGRLVATNRSTTDQWMQAVDAAFRRRVDALLSPEMAMLGLGLDAHDDADVVQGSGSTAECHRLRKGVPVGFGGPIDPDADAPRWGLPSAEAKDATAISAADLAVGAAIAERVAPDLFRPLLGRRPTRRRAVAGIAAALVLAGVALGIAGPLRAARLNAAIVDVRAERDSLVDTNNALRDVRNDVLRQATLVQAVADFRSARPDTLASIDAVERALPEGGVLYRMEIDGESLTVSGEAPSVLSLLERLEESPFFDDVALTAPLTRSPVDESLEVFSIHALHVREGGTP